MAMDYISGGELWSILAKTGGRLPEGFARFIVGSVTLMFEHVHARGYIYRDLKPENLMIGADGFLQLVDFGFAKKLPESERTYTACGTVEYMAPEIVLMKGHGREVDWWTSTACSNRGSGDPSPPLLTTSRPSPLYRWTLGVLLYDISHGYTPFTAKGEADSDMDIIRAIKRHGADADAPPLEIAKSALLGADGRKVLLGLLRPNVGRRYGAAQLKGHNFFRKASPAFDWHGLLHKKVAAPWVPKVDDLFDVSNFEPDIDDGMDGATLLGMEAAEYDALPPKERWDEAF